MRPLIAVPSYPRLEEGRVKGWHTDGIGVPIRYVESLRRAGGLEAIIMTESLVGDAVDDMLERVDGLLLLGGDDLDPATYGAAAHPKVSRVSAARDSTELDIARGALERGLPVLAICRGHQVLNVALGGSLEQHIPDLPGVNEHGRPGVAGGALEHDVSVEPGTRLATALGTTRPRASCHHHQAVVDPGATLRVVARADDGVVEGTELADASGPWVVSIQWHPEDTAAVDSAQQALFDTLVRESAT